jgi:hypothetical protein
VGEVIFPMTFPDPQRLPKRRREIHLSRRAKNPKTKNQDGKRLNIEVHCCFRHDFCATPKVATSADFLTAFWKCAAEG